MAVCEIRTMKIRSEVFFVTVNPRRVAGTAAGRQVPGRFSRLMHTAAFQRPQHARWL